MLSDVRVQIRISQDCADNFRLSALRRGHGCPVVFLGHHGCERDRRRVRIAAVDQDSPIPNEISRALIWVRQKRRRTVGALIMRQIKLRIGRRPAHRCCQRDFVDRGEIRSAIGRFRIIERIFQPDLTRRRIDKLKWAFSPGRTGLIRIVAGLHRLRVRQIAGADAVLSARIREHHRVNRRILRVALLDIGVRDAVALLLLGPPTI